VLDKVSRFASMTPNERQSALRRRVRGMVVGWSASASRWNRHTYLSYVPDSVSQLGGFPALAQAIKVWTDGKSANNSGDLPRLLLLLQNTRQILDEGVPGDIAELGVHKGHSAAILANLISSMPDRRLHLFDTFEGFDQRDLRGVDSTVGRMFADTSVEAVRRRVGHESLCDYYPGFFPETATQVATDTRFALVHVDCDLYDPTRAGLEFFYARTNPGGLIVVHDYSSGQWPGVTQAVDEFLADKPERVVLLPDKSGTAVIRRMAA
jgi:hypothetical protein